METFTMRDDDTAGRGDGGFADRRCKAGACDGAKVIEKAAWDAWTEK